MKTYDAGQEIVQEKLKEKEINKEKTQDIPSQSYGEKNMKFIDVNQQISNFLNHFPHLSDDEKLTFLHFNQFHQHRPIDEILEAIQLTNKFPTPKKY